MSTKTYTMEEFADLLKTEDSRGIINGGGVMQTIAARGIPRIIHDVRGAVRMSVERMGEDLEVTKYVTDVAEESMLEIR